MINGGRDKGAGGKVTAAGAPDVEVKPDEKIKPSDMGGVDNDDLDEDDTTPGDPDNEVKPGEKIKPSEFCSTREAALLLGVSLRTCQLWVENGVLRAWKTAGGHRRILIESVNRILEERQRILNSGGRETRGMKVVIVEDDPDLLKLLAMTISGLNLGIEVQTAQNGFEGLVLVGQVKPDLLIADLNMPGMDGFRMIRSLHGASEYRPGRIIVATALSPTDIHDRGGLPDGVTVFQKPVPFSELENLVREEYERVAGPAKVGSAAARG